MGVEPSSGPIRLLSLRSVAQGRLEAARRVSGEREPAGEILNGVKDLVLALSRLAGPFDSFLGWLTPPKHFNLTLGEESCYILEVPRVKIGLPVCARFRRYKCAVGAIRCLWQLLL